MSKNAKKKRITPPVRLYPTDLLKWLICCYHPIQIQAAKALSAKTSGKVRATTVDRMVRKESAKSFPTKNFVILGVIINELLKNDEEYRNHVHVHYPKLSRVSLDEIGQERSRGPSEAMRSQSAERTKSENPNSPTPASPEKVGRIAIKSFPSFVEAPVVDFVERPEIERIQKILVDSQTWRISLRGCPGCGKTEVARMLAQEFASKFKDGIFEIDFAIKSRKKRFDAQLRLVISAMTESPDLKSFAESDLLRGFRQSLRGKDVLLFFDNVSDSDQILPFLPDKPGSAIVASRNKFRLPGFTEVDLTAMHATCAVKFIHRIFEPHEIGLANSAHIGRMGGYNPRALRIIATHFAEMSPRTVHRAITLAQTEDFEKLDIYESLKKSFASLRPVERSVWVGLTIFPEHFSFVDAGDILESLAPNKELQTILETLRITSRIAPFEDLFDLSDSRPPSSACNPSAAGHFMIEPLEYSFLKTMIFPENDLQLLKRRHSFFYREKALWLRVLGEKVGQEDLAKEIFDRNYENFFGALCWADEHQTDEREKAAFVKYLESRNTLNYTNDRYDATERRTMAQLLEEDADNYSKLPWHWGHSKWDMDL